SLRPVRRSTSAYFPAFGSPAPTPQVLRELPQYEGRPNATPAQPHPHSPPSQRRRRRRRVRRRDPPHHHPRPVGLVARPPPAGARGVARRPPDSAAAAATARGRSGVGTERRDGARGPGCVPEARPGLLPAAVRAELLRRPRPGPAAGWAAAACRVLSEAVQV